MLDDRSNAHKVHGDYSHCLDCTASRSVNRGSKRYQLRTDSHSVPQDIAHFPSTALVGSLGSAHRTERRNRSEYPLGTEQNMALQTEEPKQPSVNFS